MWQFQREKNGKLSKYLVFCFQEPKQAKKKPNPKVPQNLLIASCSDPVCVTPISKLCLFCLILHVKVQPGALARDWTTEAISHTYSFNNPGWCLRPEIQTPGNRTTHQLTTLPDNTGAQHLLTFQLPLTEFESHLQSRLNNTRRMLITFPDAVKPAPLQPSAFFHRVVSCDSSVIFDECVSVRHYRRNMI